MSECTCHIAAPCSYCLTLAPCECCGESHQIDDMEEFTGDTGVYYVCQECMVNLNER